MNRKFFLSLLFLAALLVPRPARADGIIIPEPPILCDPCPGPVPLAQLDIRYHKVDVTITDQIAITRVDQVFHNPNDYTVEGTYVFPLPKDAAVTNFTLWIDGQPVEGKVLSADEARRIYEDIVRQMVDPALLEYAGRGAVQARIFPIDPGGDRRIQLEYSQALAAENGLVRYTYPLSTEKFSQAPLESVSVTVDVRTSAPIRAVYSPTHPVDIRRDGETHVRAGYEASGVRPDADFTLYYSTGTSEAFHLLTYRDPTDPADPDGFYLLLLAPRPDAARETLPKDVVLVLDRSGSMDGEKYTQAQQALRYILQHLNPADRFAVITFSTGLEAYAESLRPASEAPGAVRWVEQSSPAGSTDINRALLEAAALARGERPTYLIFLTDGLPTEGETDSQRILDNLAAAASPNLRLFAFGVGYDVDTFLLDSLAQAHHGASTYVVPGERIDEAVSAFYEKVSTPVLTDLALSVRGVTTFDGYPTPLPDLFVGSQIIVVGRYKDGGTGDFTLTGEVNGSPQQFAFPEQVFARDSRGGDASLEAIPRLWATRKIGYLLNEIRLRGPNQETIDQIVRLSIRYGIVTPYTSYLVTEEMSLGAAERERIAEEQFSNMMQTPAAAPSGQGAVERAMGEQALSEADSAAAPPAEATNLVRIVGTRTFVFSEGVWVDTAFDPATMQPAQVVFLSDEYFALLKAHPDLAPAFALGSEVIAFSEGGAYRVAGSESATGPVWVPSGSATPPGPAPTLGVPAESPGPVVVSTENGGSAGSPNCLFGLLPLLMLPLVVGVVRRRL